MHKPLTRRTLSITLLTGGLLFLAWPAQAGSPLPQDRSGEQKALSHLRKTGQIIGFVVAALVDLFNPEMVTLGGNIAPFLDLLLPIIREKVREASFTAQTMDLWINSASDDEALIFRGCGEVAFQELIKRASIVDMA